MKYEIGDVVKYKNSGNLYRIVGTSQGTIFTIESVQFPDTRFVTHKGNFKLHRKISKLEKALK